MVNIYQLENLGKKSVGKTLDWEFLRARNVLLGTEHVLSNE